jgi:hypothetical protein
MKKMMWLALLPVLFGASPASAQSVSYHSTGWVECPSWYMCALYVPCASTADRVVGGGTQTEGWQWQVTTIQTLPVGPSYWFGQIANTSPNTVRYQVWATCLTGPTVSKTGAAVTKPKPLAPKLERIE